MGHEKEKSSIKRVLESLPGDVMLVALDGTVLARKGSAMDSEYSSWPFVSLFNGTAKACRLYWQVPGGYDPALTVGPLELLLGDLVVSGPGYWFKRVLTEPEESLDFISLPLDIRNSVPLRLGALKVVEKDAEEALEALKALLPDLNTYQLEPGFMILKLPADQETAQDWFESILALLSEELMMDPLMINGEAVMNLGMIYPHASAIKNLCEELYTKGLRGVRSLIDYLPELAVGSLIASPLTLIKDLGRIIEPVLKDPDLSQTAEVFIRTNLNISETAQLLFLHRNTLVYRLGKIEKLTGLDLKRLDQAMAFVILKAAREEAKSGL